MNLETVWEWLLSLSKVQLILLGGSLSLLVAVSKIVRFFFLLGLLVIGVTVLLPELAQRYENSPLPAIVRELLRKGVEATQDPTPPRPPAGKERAS
ncbi:MAG: hypothetical protein NZ578_02335 [Candidatus Binatia bacterium]|nr:hypothetical protein [Candidatus Binatia bacterium]